MAFWLADNPQNRHTDTIQRFDPRFWTVNFPRPMMASVTTIAPDALRVDAVFYHRDTLAGLIWESHDSLDHPLLAYVTNRSYRRLTLSFRWRSQGIKPLDAVHGPTLTIEGRDATGAPRSWFVRLWNYAQGTPEDAQIVLPFEQLNGGFLLPQEADPVWAGDIDRMFISLIAPDYDQSSAPLTNPAIGWVEMSDIRAEGQDAMLDIGDAMVPPHGLSMATAYDDSFNQTPERILRSIRALGYRGFINHYVGMSRYFRLEPTGNALMVSLSAPTAGEEFAAINQPCVRWHRDLAERCAAMGFELILSLSYELFDAHCWNDWKQRAENGDPALTGWQPPSALLSPAHAGAMGYLQAVAKEFVAIARDAGISLHFQVGEPWWWIMPDGRICLYDAAAQTAFASLSVPIPSIFGPQSPAQNAMLDHAGEILAQSTAALVQAARAEAGSDGLTSYLLAYLPTILDERAPEAKRANLPIGWAAPAFDVLQLEDYDWVIGGRFHATERGVATAVQRLSYPADQQHYFAGFVLNAADSDIWTNMTEALKQAESRAAAARFVWAYPQIARDGYVYFAEQEDDVQAFDDVVFPLALGREAAVAPEFMTKVVSLLSGHEKRNSEWADAKLHFDVASGIRSETDLQDLIAFFRSRRGAARGFRLRDPMDFSSHGMTGNPMPSDPRIGIGDGETTAFALVKRYGNPQPDPDGAQVRRITRPVDDSVTIALDGALVSNWTLQPLGIIAFDDPPPLGAIITAGFLFDVPVRFAADRLEANFATFAAGEFASVPLVEVKEAI